MCSVVIFQGIGGGRGGPILHYSGVWSPNRSNIECPDSKIDSKIPYWKSEVGQPVFNMLGPRFESEVE